MNRILIAVVSTALLVLGLTTGISYASTGDHGHDKPWICHPVNGKGETGNGWNLIDPDHASSHIDEATGAGKHTTSDGRTDVYAVDGKCPGEQVTEPTDPTSEPTPTDEPSPTDPTSEPPVVTDPPRNPEDDTDDDVTIIGQQCNGNSCTTYFTDGQIAPPIEEHAPKPKHHTPTPAGGLPNTGA